MDTILFIILQKKKKWKESGSQTNQSEYGMRKMMEL